MSNSFFDVHQHISTSNTKFSLPSADVKCVWTGNDGLEAL